MTITPEGSTEAVESNGIGLLPEEANGSGNIENGNSPKALGTITDNNNSTNEAIYEIATGDDATADNANFNIEDNTLYYIGADSGDFETAGVKKSFTITIVRYNNEVDAGAKRSPQKLEYIVNLKNLNDNKPTDLVGYKGESTGAIDEFRVAGDVGNGDFFMVLNVDAKDDTLTINFTLGDTTPSTGDAYSALTVMPQYDDAADNTKVTGFTIKVGTTALQNVMVALNDKENTNRLRNSSADFTVWNGYINFVAYSGSKSGTPSETDVLFTSDPVTLTARPTIEVHEGTDGIIANFDSTDADNLQPLRYSLDGADADAFAIDENGNLRFAATPNYASPTDVNGNNFYKVTVKVSDGLAAHDKTYDLLVQVIEVTE